MYMLLVAVVVVILGAVYQNTKGFGGSDNILGDTEIPTNIVPIESTSIPTPFESISKTPITRSPTSTPSALNTDKSGSNVAINNLLYPGAMSVASDTSRVELTSTDDADVITEWYKNKLKSMGLNTKAFVATKTNNNIQNKLSASDGKTEIEIEITRPTSQSQVKIIVTVRST